MPFCPNCGKEVETGVRFCPNCGAQLGSSAGPQVAPTAPRGPSRPALASILIMCYLGLGIVFVFLGAETVFISTYFTAGLLAVALVLFLGIGVLALLTVYGFLKGGRWASTYIAVTGIFSVADGALLVITHALLLSTLGSIAILLGVITLAYLRFGNARAYLLR